LHGGDQGAKSLFKNIAINAMSNMTGIVQSDGLLILEYERIQLMNIRASCKPTCLKNQLVIYLDHQYLQPYVSFKVPTYMPIARPPMQLALHFKGTTPLIRNYCNLLCLQYETLRVAACGQTMPPPAKHTHGFLLWFHSTGIRLKYAFDVH
jgi:hypothetical protein